jgi:drug/metabolite transporter (DMT)-like permease
MASILTLQGTATRHAVRMVDGQVPVGMAAAALAAVCFDGAVILQAREAQAVDAVHALKVSMLRRLATRPRWVLGSALGVLGWPLQLLALSLAPITVVQPMLALGLIVLLLGGARALHERVGQREWRAAGAVIAGVVLLALAGPAHTDAVPGPYATAAVLLALGAVVAWPYVAGRRASGAWSLILGAGCAFALSTITSKLLTVELARGRLLPALAWAAATAVFAGVGFLTDMTAMQRVEATRVAPPMFVLETALPVALAPLLFDERWSGTLGGGVVVVMGLALVLVGGGLLGARRLPQERAEPAPRG